MLNSSSEKSRHKQRLEAISHHFLSEEEHHPKTATEPPIERLLPIISLEAEAAQHLQRLRTGLESSGHSCDILDVNIIDWHRAASTQITVEASHSQKMHFSLSVINLLQSQLPQSTNTLALMVPSKMEDLQEAYRILRTIENANLRRIGIILTNCVDRRCAWVHFKKLATESRRCLQIPLINLGYLAQTTAPWDSMVPGRILYNKFFMPYPQITSNDTH